MIANLIIILLGLLLIQVAMKTEFASICPNFLILQSLFIITFGFCQLFGSLSSKFDFNKNYSKQENYSYDENHPKGT